MIDFLMISGFLILFLGLPASVIVTIVFLIKKRKVLIPAICIPITFFVGIIVLGIGGILYGDTDEYKQAVKEREQLEQQLAEEEKQQEIEEAKKKAEEEAKRTFEYAKTTVKFMEYKIEENLGGQKCLTLYFDFTNNSKENQTFCYLFSTKAFQDGVGMDSSYVHVNEETKNSSKEIKPGVTIRVCEMFILNSETGTIDVEIEPFSIWSDRVLFEYEIELGE